MLVVSSFIKSFALEIILSEIPSFLLIIKALLRPGTPTNNLYVGDNVSKLNSTLAFSKPSVTRAKFSI